MTELTKDSDFLACCIYREYCRRRKDGIPKRQANYFESDFKANEPKLSKWLQDDYLYTIGELKRAGFVKSYLYGNFAITDQFVIYMENRFKKGLIEVTDFIAKFIP